jgi:hypothetical protein
MRQAKFYAVTKGKAHFARDLRGMAILACTGRAVEAYTSWPLAVKPNEPLCKACDHARLMGKIEGV